MKNYITQDMTTEQRLRRIKLVHERMIVRKAVDATLALAEAKEERALARQMAKEGFTSDQENINAYTDGPKYLAEHYGERLAEQTHYESAEGWN